VERGILYGISVGTGDPELITVKGLRLLQKLPIVAFPKGKGSQKGIAQSIIKSYLQPHQYQLALDFPYLQDPQILSQSWEKAALTVWEFLQQGKDIAFACVGDVSFYSTFTYLAQTLQKLDPDAKIQAIPGVSSPMAAAAALALPLTMQDQSLAVLPVLYTLDQLEQVLNWAEVVVLLKVSSVYHGVWQVLRKRNLLDRAWVVERASFPQQVIYQNLGDYPTLNLSYFSILIIHNYS
jgi:precorrin-2/cobalt-factor-2 C20-methyltransferase